MRTVSENSTPSFEELVGELGGQLSGYLTKMVGNSADADDLLQETLLRIATNLPGFEHRSSLKTWAFRIATNVAIDFLRKSKRAELTEIDEAGIPSNLDEIVCRSTTGLRWYYTRWTASRWPRWPRYATSRLPPQRSGSTGPRPGSATP
jgi:RNA polymerase sigma factor (sigma-70 family)